MCCILSLNLYSFLRHHLHGGLPETADVETLKLQVSELTQKNEELKDEVNQLKQKVWRYMFLTIQGLKGKTILYHIEVHI